MTAQWLGNVEVDAVVSFIFTTHDAAGGNVAPSSAFEAADVRIYRGASATQRSSSSGITMVSPFDSLTGVHCVEIDTSDDADAGFYSAGQVYHVVLAPDETIDGQAVNAVIANFGIAHGHLSVVSSLVDMVLARIGTPSNLGGGATIAANLSDIEGQTDDIGAAGAGLTALASAANLSTVSSNVSAILADTGTDGVVISSSTMTSIADALLKRDMSAVTGEASRSLLNALRFLRNKWSVSGSTLTVTKEDDTTAAWTAALTTNAAADPVTASDPS